MHSVKLSAGYRVPKGTTMADVRRLDQELLASEGLESQSHKAKGEAKGGREECSSRGGVAPVAPSGEPIAGGCVGLFGRRRRDRTPA